MSNEPKDLRPESWHRYFAVECNNLAWSLAAKQNRTAEETRTMLDAAHSASWHWRIAGNELNQIRADMLVAETQALAGFGASAWNLATSVLEYIRSHPSPDWELALAHAIHAHAAYVAEELEQYRQSYQNAEVAIGRIADKEDQRIVMETFYHVPKPE